MKGEGRLKLAKCVRSGDKSDELEEHATSYTDHCWLSNCPSKLVTIALRTSSSVLLLAVISTDNS